MTTAVTPPLDSDQAEPEPLAADPPVFALRRAEAARALGISPRTLWSLTASGEVPHVRIGKSVVYPVVALQEWLAERARKSMRRRTGSG